MPHSQIEVVRGVIERDLLDSHDPRLRRQAVGAFPFGAKWRGVRGYIGLTQDHPGCGELETIR